MSLSIENIFIIYCLEHESASNLIKKILKPKYRILKQFPTFLKKFKM